jgi:DNA-binding NarL/FixJ family response regulator
MELVAERLMLIISGMARQAKGTHMPVTLLLADNSPVVREGLKAVLKGRDDFRVIGETGNGLEAVRLAIGLHPDVLIVDVMMPGLSGLEVTRQVCQRLPSTRVLVLSMSGNEAHVLEALRSGATGYVLKNVSLIELMQAVHSVAAGRRYLSLPLSELIFEVQAQRVEIDEIVDPYETLTTREREVLHLAAEGRTNAEIAAALGISPRTVETHRGNLMRKLGLRTLTDLIRYALRRGILPME